MLAVWLSSKKKKKKKKKKKENFQEKPQPQNAAHVFICLYCYVTHKRDIDKQSRPRSDAAEHGVWSGSSLFALSLDISIKHDNTLNYPDTPFLEMNLSKELK